jgi:ubiquitin-like protein Pup
MGKQTTSTRASSATKTSDKSDETVASLAERGRELDAGIDALLNEIDDILEENAEEFVNGYVQRGGE